MFDLKIVAASTEFNLSMLLGFKTTSNDMSAAPSSESAKLPFDTELRIAFLTMKPCLALS